MNNTKNVIHIRALERSQKGSGYVTKNGGKDAAGRLIGGPRGRVIIITRWPTGMEPDLGDEFEYNVLRENPGSTLIELTRRLSTEAERAALDQQERQRKEATWNGIRDQVHAQLTWDGPHTIEVGGARVKVSRYAAPWRVSPSGDAYVRTLSVYGSLEGENGPAFSVKRDFEETCQPSQAVITAAEDTHGGFALLTENMGVIPVPESLGRFLGYEQRGTEVFARYMVRAPGGAEFPVEILDGKQEKGKVSWSSYSPSACKPLAALRDDPAASLARTVIAARMEAAYVALCQEARDTWVEVGDLEHPVEFHASCPGGGLAVAPVPQVRVQERLFVSRRLAEACVRDQGLVRPGHLPVEFEILFPYGDVQKYIESLRSEEIVVARALVPWWFDGHTVEARITSAPAEKPVEFLYTAEIDLPVRVEQFFRFADCGWEKVKVGERSGTATIRIEKIAAGEVEVNGPATLTVHAVRRRSSGNLTEAIVPSDFRADWEDIHGWSVVFEPPRSQRQRNAALEEAMGQILELVRQGAIVAGYRYSDNNGIILYVPWDTGNGEEVAWHISEMIVARDSAGTVEKISFDRRKGTGSLKGNFSVSGSRPPTQQEIARALAEYKGFGWPVVRDPEIPVGQPLRDFLGITE